MIVKEFEGKRLLREAELSVPSSVLISKADFSNEKLLAEFLQTVHSLQFPVFAKAQVFHGNRELEGLIIKVDSHDILESSLATLFTKKDRFGQGISHILVEESINFVQQLYVTISYSTKTRTPVIQFSKEGGVGMDDRGQSVVEVPISISAGVTAFSPYPELLPTVQKLFKVFIENDASLVEINPLVQTNTSAETGNDYICLDAKIELEDSAKFRHPEWEQYGERSAIAKPLTPIEQRAREISRSDTRGVAGESFFEFPGGNIGVMASGGGASTLAMDALLSEGLSPANYTEYSGNPTREKVYKLAQLVLSLPKLEALYVVGSNANFTDIYETLVGVIDGLVEAELPDNFKVLIRRGGPRWQEAFEMVQQRIAEKEKQSGKKIRLKLFGPDFSIVKTARELKQMFEGNDQNEIAGVSVDGAGTAQIGNAGETINGAGTASVGDFGKSKEVVGAK